MSLLMQRLLKRGGFCAPIDEPAGAAGGGSAGDSGAAAGAAGAAAGNAAGDAANGGSAAPAAGSGSAAAGAAGSGAAGDAAGAAGAGKGAGDAGQGDKGATDPWLGLREKIATKDGKVDDKILSRINRYATPEAAVNALLSIQSKIGAGEYRSVLPKNASNDEIKTWRAENGIPEDPAKYELKLADGLVVGAEDKPIIDGFLASAHKANLTSQQASAAVDWYYDQLEAQTEAKAAADKVTAREAQDALRTEWGTEYRANENLIMGLIESAPTGVKDQFLHGRLADGTPIMSHVPTLKWLNQMAREINPVGAIIPNAGANTASAVEDQIKTIENVMKTDRKAYNADEKMQARLRDLYTARDRANGTR